MPFKSNSIFPNKGCFTHGIILLTGFFALAVERFQTTFIYEKEYIVCHTRIS